MPETESNRLTAFEGMRLLASGPLAAVRQSVLAAEAHGAPAPILIFDDETGSQIDIDLRAVPDQTQVQVEGAAGGETRRAGRPRLGVIGREVTLLPRHWDWLASQKGGASVALRRLVDDARKASATKDVRRGQQEAAYRFMSAMAGNLPDFEEAIRALFAGNDNGFTAMTASWPTDVRDYATRLATGQSKG